MIAKKIPWDRLVEQMVTKDPSLTYEKIGSEVGISRSAVGRMALDPNASEPKHSVGMSLIAMHQSVLEGTYQPLEKKDA